MPSHGRSKVSKIVSVHKNKGYIGSTTHRGTIIIREGKQHRFIHYKSLPHTHWYRSKNGNIYGRRSRGSVKFTVGWTHCKELVGDA